MLLLFRDGKRPTDQEMSAMGKIVCCSPQEEGQGKPCTQPYREGPVLVTRQKELGKMCTKAFPVVSVGRNRRAGEQAQDWPV